MPSQLLSLRVGGHLALNLQSSSEPVELSQWHHNDDSIVNIVIGIITTTVFRPFFRDHPGEPVPEENFWTLWCKGRLTEADKLTTRLGAIPSGLTSAHLHHPPIFLQAGCPSCCPTNSIKALKATALKATYIVVKEQKTIIKLCMVPFLLLHH